jgi:hypothetical protein
VSLGVDVFNSFVLFPQDFNLCSCYCMPLIFMAEYVELHLITGTLLGRLLQPSLIAAHM